MEQKLISVIVPVYRAEQELDRCVGSIRNQTYQNLEILLIEDGSPDRCGELCDGYAREDSRIRVVHQKNAGQSAARNRGLDMMTGDLVGFVDSDDWIEEDYYERLLRHMEQTGADVAACGTQWDYPDGRVAYFNLAYPGDREKKCYSRREAIRESLLNQRITYSLVDKLYKKEIFDGLRLKVGTIYEDMELVPRIIERTERIAYDPLPGYHYNLTGSSTIRGIFRPERFTEVDLAAAKIPDYQNRYPELYDLAVAAYLSICLNVIHLSAGTPACAARRKELIRQLRQPLPAAGVALLRRNDRIKLRALKLGAWAYEGLMGLYQLKQKR